MKPKSRMVYEGQLFTTMLDPSKVILRCNSSHIGSVLMEISFPEDGMRKEFDAFLADLDLNGYRMNKCRITFENPIDEHLRNKIEEMKKKSEASYKAERAKGYLCLLESDREELKRWASQTESRLKEKSRELEEIEKKIKKLKEEIA